MNVTSIHPAKQPTPSSLRLCIERNEPHPARSWAIARLARWRTVGLVFLLALAAVARSQAETLEAGGLLFSDELGSFRLISATGEGTPSDPIVLVEEITGIKPAVLTIRQNSAAGSHPPSQKILLRSLVKIVINRSAWRWSGFDLELRDRSGHASVYSDGLSFDQLRAIPQPLHSDLFDAIHAEYEPFDRLRFDQGQVEPEQTVRLAFNLVDINPRPLFYLAQAPIVLLASVPWATTPLRFEQAAAPPYP